MPHKSLNQRIEVPAPMVSVIYDGEVGKDNAHEFNIMFVRNDLTQKLLSKFGGDQPSPQLADNMTFNDMLEALLRKV